MIFKRFAILPLAVAAVPAHAHHVMDYALPATALQGFLSGLAHPVIGIDHLLFVAGAGLLAARAPRGFFLPFLFVLASVVAVWARAAGAELPLGEVAVATSVLVLAALLLTRGVPAHGAIAGLFLLAGAVHGYALGESIVGAEKAPLYAYLAGLAVVLGVIGTAVQGVVAQLFKYRPALPLYRAAGAVLGLAGIYFFAGALA